MATFEYQGTHYNVSGPGFSPGKTDMIYVPRKDGTREALAPPNPATGWVAGDVTGEITDSTCIRLMASDTQQWTQLT